MLLNTWGRSNTSEAVVWDLLPAAVQSPTNCSLPVVSVNLGTWWQFFNPTSKLQQKQHKKILISHKTPCLYSDWMSIYISTIHSSDYWGKRDLLLWVFVTRHRKSRAQAAVQQLAELSRCCAPWLTRAVKQLLWEDAVNFKCSLMYFIILCPPPSKAAPDREDACSPSLSPCMWF